MTTTTITTTSSNLISTTAAATGQLVEEYIGDASPAERMETLKRLAAQGGFRLPETRVPEGEALLPSGLDRLRQITGEVNNLPSPRDALAGLVALHALEQPKDAGIRWKNLVMHSSGLIGDAQVPNVALAQSSTGLEHVVQLVKPRGVQTASAMLRSLPGALRAQVFNEWATQRAARDDKDATVYLRTYRPEGGKRVVRAVVSSAYSPVEDMWLLAALLKARLPAASRDAAKVRVDVREDGSTIEVIFPLFNREIRVGDVLWAYIRLDNSQTKQGSVRVSAGVFRVLCYNCTTAYSADHSAEALRHVGAPDRMVARIVEAISAAALRIEPLCDAFTRATDDALPPGGRSSALEKLEKAKLLTEGEAALAATAWDADGERSAGDTMAGLVNALTRGSQQLRQDEAAHVEALAGRLLMEGLGGVLSNPAGKATTTDDGVIVQ